MKLLILFLSLLLFNFSVKAQDEDPTAPTESPGFSNFVEENGDTDDTENDLPPRPTNQKQNQQETQNQGEEMRIQIESQEQEALEAGTGDQAQKKAQNAQENMSDVAKKVQELLENKERFGGIGNQISQFAQEQNAAHNRLESGYERLKNRNTLIKRLFGSDRSALVDLKGVQEENRERIQELKQLQEEVPNISQKIQIAELIEMLENQNSFIEEKVTEEESVKGILGFLVNLSERFSL